jgi:hypothetical protein
MSTDRDDVHSVPDVGGIAAIRNRRALQHVRELQAALRREAGDAAITAAPELARLLHDAADELERLTDADGGSAGVYGAPVTAESKPGDTSE